MHSSYQESAISLTFAFSHHPQAVDDHVSRRMNGAPGVLAGDVFDEGRIASAGLVEDLDLHPFGKACLQPVPFLFVAWFLALAHVAEETGLIDIACIHGFDLVFLLHHLTSTIDIRFTIRWT